MFLAIIKMTLYDPVVGVSLQRHRHKGGRVKGASRPLPNAILGGIPIRLNPQSFFSKV